MHDIILNTIDKNTIEVVITFTQVEYEITPESLAKLEKKLDVEMLDLRSIDSRGRFLRVHAYSPLDLGPSYTLAGEMGKLVIEFFNVKKISIEKKSSE
jgi:hypothetical protein